MGIPADSCVMLLSDFGRDDIFVAEVELELRKRIDAVQIVHVTHSIRPQDVTHAAILLASWINAGQRPGDVTVCMVDPDTTRQIVVASCEGHRIVAPNNGCLTLIADQLDQVEIWEGSVLCPSEPDTFRGRSVIPGIVSQLLKGTVSLAESPPNDVVEQIPDAQPDRLGTSRLSGRLLHVDHFGNVMTNVPNAWVDDAGWYIQVGSLSIDRWMDAYHEANDGELMLVQGSGGFVEISVQCGRASDFDELEIGQTFELLRSDVESGSADT